MANNMTTEPTQMAEPIQTTQTTQTIPPLPIPNRYNTVVAVEVYNGDALRQIKWFSDIQMAWIWIKDQTICSPTVEWDILSFIASADEMDVQWRLGHGENGICIAIGGQYEFIAYYETSVNYEDVRGREEFV